MPRLECFVGQTPRPISPDNPQWYMPLPLNRQAAAAPEGAEGSAITYGDYFTAVCDYLSRPLIKVPAPSPGEFIFFENASRIHIHLIKHGAFYHPALVTVAAGDASLPLVVNVAVSPEGQRQLPIEVESLLKLEHHFSENRIPQIYGAGSGCAPGHPPFPMFIGQWFVDFHEVHRTLAAGQTQRWSVWDTSRGSWCFNDGQVADYFRQAIRILTGCFDPHTLSAILDWHNGAGDFVVRKHDDGLDVRLITVRRYAPLFQQADGEAIDGLLLLESLAALWMRTSMWMRIDRADGVGDLVWADDQTVAPMWEGFVQGLQIMAQHNAFPESFIAIAGRYLAGYTPREWLNMGVQITARYPSASPETALIKLHLDDHALRTAGVVQAGV